MSTRNGKYSVLLYKCAEGKEIQNEEGVYIYCESPLFKSKDEAKLWNPKAAIIEVSIKLGNCNDIVKLGLLNNISNMEKLDSTTSRKKK